MAVVLTFYNPLTVCRSVLKKILKCNYKNEFTINYSPSILIKLKYYENLKVKLKY